MSRLKSVYFMDYVWNLDEAINWMRAHRVNYIDVRHEGHQWRFIVIPKEYFSYFRVKIVRSHFIPGQVRNVYLVIGFP